MFDVLRSDFGFAAGCLVAAHLVAPQSPSRTAMSVDKQTNNTSSGCEPTNTTPRASGQAAASTGTSTGYASSSDHTLRQETAATVLARRIECEQARSRKQWEQYHLENDQSNSESIYDDEWVETCICATKGCTRVGEYWEGNPWNCCCKTCSLTDGTEHDAWCDNNCLTSGTAHRASPSGCEPTRRKTAKQTNNQNRWLARKKVVLHADGMPDELRRQQMEREIQGVDEANQATLDMQSALQHLLDFERRDFERREQEKALQQDHPPTQALAESERERASSSSLDNEAVRHMQCLMSRKREQKEAEYSAKEQLLRAVMVDGAMMLDGAGRVRTTAAVDEAARMLRDACTATEATRAQVAELKRSYQVMREEMGSP